METPSLLRDLVVLVAVAIPVVALAQRFRIPSIVGFLLAGLAIGPSGVALVRDTASVSGIAEMGVVLLLFAIGLELSLTRVLRLGRALLQGGTLQVGGTLAAVAGIAAALGSPLPRAILYGALVALSSTAIILKVYSERGALEGPDGRIVVPIAVFQDLCIIPLVLLVELLAGGDQSVWRGVLTVATSLATVAIIVVGGRIALPWLLAQVAKVRSRELFTLSIVFLGVGAAFVTDRAGLSLALGAFLAGLVISESEYGAQALSDVIPFRDALTGIFFASVGMLLDTNVLARTPWAFAAATIGIIALKAVVATAAAVSLGRPLQVSIVAGLGLAQIGEFSFVLATIALPSGLLTADGYQLFLGASVLTMLAAPFVIAGAPAVAGAVARTFRQPVTARAAEGVEDPEGLRDHVIIVGYGVNGRNLARVLDGAGVSYVILEQNAETVRAAREETQPILFGDATRAEMLERVHIDRARVIVFAISSPSDELRGVTAARALNPTIRIIVRTRSVHAMPDLQRAGATDVVPEEFETSLEIFSRVLRYYAVPSNAIAREIAAARTELYGMALGGAGAASQLEALAQLGVHHAIDLVEVEAGSRAEGGHPVTLNIRHTTGATVVAVVRDARAIYTPDPEFRFRPGDAVLLVGDDEALAKGRELFLRELPANGQPLDGRGGDGVQW
jgi:CPA2 family monovalent cation:H+ antiporter-2